MLQQPYIRWVGVNLIFLTGHPAAPFAADLPEAARALTTAAALILLPASGWALCVGAAPRSPLLRVARATAVSVAVMFVVLAGLAATGVHPTATAAWNALWAVTLIGMLAGGRLTRRPVRRRALVAVEATAGVAAFLLAFALFFWGATRVVPPQNDQDLEVVGTGYGLLTRFEPLLLTDRHSVYFFAHPPLLHFQAGMSYLLHGAMADLRVYYESSSRVRDAWERRPFTPPATLTLEGRIGELPVAPGVYAVTGVDGIDYVVDAADRGRARVPIEIAELDRIYSHYQRVPRQVASRAPNVFFGALTVAMITLWAGRVSRRWWVGLLVAGAYATSPEVFVRSSYGGYYAIGAFFSVLLIAADESWRRAGGRRWAWLAGVIGLLAALADHKLILLPAALGLVALFAPPAGRTGGWLARIHPAAAGFAAGTLLFWAWGFAIAPSAFLDDHLRGHLIDRLTHHNPFEYGGYPDVPALWREFNAHTGFLLLPAGLALIAAGAAGATGPVPQWRAQAMTGWLVWVILTAVVFSVVDWRMTKHLLLMAVPLSLGLVFGHRGPPWRHLVTVVLAVALIAVNLRMLAVLAEDFGAFRVTPAW